MITSKDIEAVVAIMARIPPKSVNKNDKENLKNLERDLKNFVFGQDKAIEELSSQLNLQEQDSARMENLLDPIYSQGQLELERQKWRDN